MDIVVTLSTRVAWVGGEKDPNAPSGMCGGVNVADGKV